ncbi:MAG TPA: PP2C family protein-serine/threonine phosphatase [Bryobacteraceae bacterium]|nr:PP2C family protein-serine/threonine phosphatase [Bryobacteraceae bacterium]
MLSETLAMESGHDWATACDVQQRFMQHPIPEIDAWDYAGRCRQMQALGGDCYNFTPLSGNRLALAVGDASGKGLAAALMISNVQSSLRTAALFAGDDIATIFDVVNRQVHASSLANHYATLFYGIFDDATRTLRYVNAGHNPPLVLRRDGSLHWLETSGAPVGMFPDWTYCEECVALHAGDLIVAYTDGVVETANPLSEEWGVGGLKKAAEQNRGESAGDVLRGIFASMDDFTGGRQTDDATIAVLRVH